MKKSQTLVLATLGLYAMLRVNPARGEEFYATRLRAGSDALRAGKPIDAIEELRIACFGFLNEPPLLSESLSRLALAQQAAGRQADVDATLQRLVDVERRFGSFPKAALEAESKQQVLELLAKRMPPATLLAVPAFAGLVETEDQRLSKLTRKERTRALERKAESEPTSVAWPLALARDAAARSDHRSTITWASRALELEPTNSDAAALRGHARAARKDWAGAVADLSALPEARLKAEPSLVADMFVAQVGQKTWEGAAAYRPHIPEELRARPDVAAAEKRMPMAAAQAPGVETPASAPTAPPPPVAVAPPPPAVGNGTLTVPETLSASRRLINDRNSADAQKLLIQAVQRSPASRDLRKALLEAAVLNRDWPTASSQVRFIEPLSDGEEAWMFYASVAHFEAGSLEAARALMRRARGKIASSPFVDYYARRILGG